MRRMIACLLTMLILLPSSLSTVESRQASAATNNAEKVISVLDILTIDHGKINASTERITRSQYAQLLIKMSSLKASVVVSSNVTLFSDVAKNHWAAGYIKTVISKGWMSGYLNGTFKPDKGVTLLEAVNGVLKLLGYTDSDFSGNIVGSKMALYTSKELNKNITVTKKTSYLSYSNCINLFYNTLKATTKEGKVYAETLGYVLDSKGELDYLSLINSGTIGPIIADDNWKYELPFTVSDATCYKNGIKCSYSAISDNDVLYYSKTFKTIWAYDNKVTGTVQSINPDYLSPESVTVLGKTFILGTSDTIVKFSSMGNIKEGDIVTLLLGKDDSVADVLSPDELNTTITGVVLSIGTHMIEKTSGNYVNTKYVTFVDASGNEYEQDYDANTITFSEDALISVCFKDGTATVSNLVFDSSSLDNCIISSDASTLGTIKLSSNVKILDLNDGEYINVYPERLAGVRLSKYYIYYYELNDNGELTQLILSDVTGDMDQYGIFTGFDFTNFSDKATYSYLINGKEGGLTTNTFSDLITTIGPIGFVFENNVLTKSYKLTETPITYVGKTSVQNSDSKYLLSDDCDIYCLVEGEYVITTIDKISNLSKYIVTAYYDKAMFLGGRIRIIIAESIN